ncbi:MAG: iron-sulfur cluster carrier protein ApbC [Xanthomonadales bacterium]|nr:iron-sulfur cluster carrier protein ApbC [Xanthomonadales bacterium]
MSVKESAQEILAVIEDAYTGTDLVSAGVVRGVGADGKRIAVELRLGYPLSEQGLETLRGKVRDALEADPGIEAATVTVGWKVASHAVQGELKPLEQIRNVIAVASGKGGVGKSTTAVNLALALAREGARVGILDADIYGPSIPRMLGVSGRPETDGKRIEPKQAHGLQVMSIGFLVEEETPMIWRGPMVTSALQQLLGETNWNDLDYLVVDLPPGTGDIQLTLAQKVPVAGAVIVTTPQDIALLDARKAFQMFRKVGVPVLGVVENMSTHVCSQCGHEEAIFGEGGGQAMAGDYDIPLLGQLPLAREIRASLDSGQPTVVSAPGTDIADSYVEFARRTAGALSQKPRNLKAGLPGIVVQNQ